MTTVGIRELRQRASDLLRLVAAGETVEITDRGRPVALLTPVSGGDVLADLIRRGDLTPATDLSDFTPPPVYSGEAPSATLAKLRAHER
jgi:prevent-host-death family protein